MADDFRSLFGNFIRHRGAAKYAVQQAWATLGFAPPDDVLAVLTYTNGGEGFLGQAYFRLYSVEEITRLNTAYRVAAYAPGLVLFGSNGGGEAYGFDTRSTPAPIVQIPFIPMDFKYAEERSQNFLTFLHALADKNLKPGAPMPRINRAAVGKEVHQRHPIVHGGSPTDPANQVLVPSDDHAKLCVFWNDVYFQQTYGRKV